jgi:TorA maturation chaperone TorD
LGVLEQIVVLNSVLSLPAEEAARANVYGLLARLFYAPPDAALLKSLTDAPDIQAEDGGELASAWKALKQVAATSDPEAVRDEYDTVFVGTGKSPVTLYVCAYSIRYSSDTPLAALRGELARLGLGRREGVNEPEDHIATLCDTMRHLIAVQRRELDEQRAFFMRWIAPSFAALCDAIEAEPQTAFYKPVARFAKVFFDIERTAFELH